MASGENNLRDKVVVITGASSGFGRGTAIGYADAGARVVLAARSGDAIEQIAKQCDTSGVRAIAVTTDVSSREDVERLAAKTLERFGRFDVWINNAGVAAIGRFDQVPLEDHEQVIRTDVLGTIYGSYAALKHFRQRGDGILINIASVLGKIPTPLYASYVAAKFAVVGLSDSIRQELGEEKIDKIRVCTVMPMAHDTGFFEHAGNYTGRESMDIPPTYDPQVTIDKLVELGSNPEDEVITGAQGKLFNVFHKLMPAAVEKYMAFSTERRQLEQADPAPNTSGAVHRASESTR